MRATLIQEQMKKKKIIVLHHGFVSTLSKIIYLLNDIQSLNGKWQDNIWEF